MSMLPDGTRVTRMRLRVTDAEAAERFYRRVVGLTTFDRTGSRIDMGTPGDGPFLVLDEDTDAAPRGDDEAGLFHWAIDVPGEQAIADLLGRIRQEGWTLADQWDHVMTAGLYVDDPEGNRLEVHYTRPREEWTFDEEGLLTGVDRDHSTRMDLERLERLADPAADRLPDDSWIGHIHLNVSDLGAAERFYRGTLGLERTYEEDGEVLFVAAGGYHHHVSLNARHVDRPVDGRKLGLADWELSVPDRTTLVAVRQRLREHGDAVEERDEGIRVVDPDGIPLDIAAGNGGR